MSGIWYIVVPEAGQNYVKNPSAEADGNYNVLTTGSPSVSASPSGSASPSASASISPSASTSPSASQSRSPSASQSRSPSASASPSGSASPSSSVSVSPSPSAGIAAVARVTTRARFGNYCYQVTPNTAYEGFSLVLETLANAIHYVSLYLFDNVTGTPQVALDGRAFFDMTLIGGADGSWQRWGVQVPALNASGSTRLSIRLTTAEVFSVDAVQVEQNTYGTTYIDGDRDGLYRWSGLRHGSYSTRSAQERAGGRERNLLDDYGVEVVEGTKRIGTPPITHNLLGQSLQPGAIYQGSKVLPREIELHLNYSSDTWAGFHGKRNDVFDLLKPDLVRGSQPVVIGYAGAGTNKKVYASFYYSGGMEFGDFLSYDEVAPVRLLAPDPFWYADDQETASLDYQDTITSDASFARESGQWGRVGPSAFNEQVRAIKVDAKRGRVYFGGRFTAAGSVTVNGICYWDGTSFVRMGGGVAGGDVNAIAIAANGDVWIGGSFTTVDGTASRNNVAKWNISTGTWTNFGTTGTGTVNAIGIAPSGLIYFGGSFSNWNGNANADAIVTYNGSAWAALGTGAVGAVLAISVYSESVVYIGGTITSLNGVSVNCICYWNGTTAVAMAGGTSATGVSAIVTVSNGTVYIGGAFDTVDGNSWPAVASWNGTSWQSLNGTSAFTTSFTCKSLAVLPNGNILAGIYDVGSSKDYVYLWNGSVFSEMDFSTEAATSEMLAADAYPNGDCFIGFDVALTAYISGITSASNSGTSATFPRFSVINENTSGSCTVRWLENQSSNHVLYFDMDVQAGETVELDLSSSQKKLTSDWRGSITDNPLAASDVVNWRLLPGPNTIAAFITGTITSVVALLHWTPRYWSADGNA